MANRAWRHGILIVAILAVGIVPAASPDRVEKGPKESRNADERIEAPGGGHLEVPVPPPSEPVRREDLPTESLGSVMRGMHESVQVNVDSLGNNIVGDAANEPSIGIDPTDRDNIVIGWRQFDTITSDFRQAGYAYSHDGGTTWTFPGVLQPGQFRSDPVLAADSTGVFFYYSLSTTTNAEMFISYDKGVNWTGPINAHGGDKNWMNVDITGGTGNDHVYNLWNSQFTCCDPGTDYNRSIDNGITYQGPFAMPQHPKWGTLDVGPDGELYITGAQLSGSGHLVLRSDSARDPSKTPVFEQSVAVDLGGNTSTNGTPNPGGLLGQVWVAVDRSSGATRGNVYVLGSVNPAGDDPLDVHFIRSTDGGQTWSAPVRVNDDASTTAYQWFGTMSVAPDGRIDVVWNDTRNSASATESELYYAYSTDAGSTWSAGLPVSPSFNSLLGHPQQNKIGDYYHMMSDTLGGALAYSATFNGEQDVWFLRVGDCNGNSRHDSLDVGDGTSEDCNADGVPDECEPDCNFNGVPDGCDIDGGTSIDCNGNVVPDECEPDCNLNDVADECDITGGTSDDCNGNLIPDECDATDGSLDCDGDGLLDACDIYDDLETVTGWTVGAGDDTATTGIWERVDPVGTQAQPEDDHTEAPGTFCFVTGQGAVGGGLGDNDVDGGKTTLLSPTLDLSAAEDPAIGYYRWFSNDTGSTPNTDVFTVDISTDGGANWSNVEVVGPAGDETGGGWYYHQFRVLDKVTSLTANTVLRFVAADLNDGSLVEAAVDDLVVVDCPACAFPAAPGESANLRMWMSTATVADLSWTDQADAETYDLYRGTLRDASDLSCFQQGLTGETTSDDGQVPSPGEGFYHVVAAVNCRGVSPLGEGRTAFDPCP